MNEHSNRGSSPDGTPLADHDKSADASLDDAFNDIFESGEWGDLEVFPPEAEGKRDGAAEMKGERAAAVSSPTTPGKAVPSTAEIPVLGTSSSFEGSVEIMTGPRVQVRSARTTQLNFQGPALADAPGGPGEGDDDDGNLTMFGRPSSRASHATAGASKGQVKTERGGARGPWTTQQSEDPEEGRATFKPWEALNEDRAAWVSDDDDLDDEMDVRKTFFGKPSPFARAQQSAQAPARVSQTEETGRPAASDVRPGPRLPRFGAGGGRPAPFRAPERVPARAAAKEIRRRSSGTLVGAPAVSKHVQPPHEPSRSGAVDTVEKVNPNPDVGPPQKAPQPRPSGSRTAALPALFAANKEDGATLEDDGKKTDPPWRDKKKTRGAMAAPPMHGDGLFRVPTRESLKRRTSSRRTLSGVPSVSGGGVGLSKGGAGAPGSSESGPGEYVMGKAKLTQSSSRIRVRRDVARPSQTLTGMPRVELPSAPATPDQVERGGGGLTMPMAAPNLSVGAADHVDIKVNPLEGRVVPGGGGAKPGVTRPLSVPVFGQRGSNEGKPARSESLKTPQADQVAEVPEITVEAEARTSPEPEVVIHMAYAETMEAGALRANGEPLLVEASEPQAGEVEVSAEPDAQGEVSVEGAVQEAPEPEVESPTASVEPLGDPQPVTAEEAPVSAPEVSAQATSLKKTALSASVAKGKSSDKAASAAPGTPSEWPVRVIAMLAGGMCWVATVSFAVSLGDVDVMSLPVSALAALGGLLVGGLVAIVVGVMKLHLAMRALLMGLVGAVCGALLLSAEWIPLATLGDESSRWLVFATLLLPMGLFWRERYPKSSLSRVVVGVGMLLLLANYLAPVSGGALRFESILLMLNEPGGLNMALGCAALLPLALWLPSLMAFRSGEGRSFGVAWSLMYCGCLLLLMGIWAMSSLQPDEGDELLRWVGCGLASAALAASFSAGGGELLGWMTRPDSGD